MQERDGRVRCVTRITPVTVYSEYQVLRVLESVAYSGVLEYQVPGNVLGVPGTVPVPGSPHHWCRYSLGSDTWYPGTTVGVLGTVPTISTRYCTKYSEYHLLRSAPSTRNTRREVDSATILIHMMCRCSPKVE